MSATTKPPIVYPDSDGKPMADNTLQFEWIVTIKYGLEIMFAGRDDVFVAGDLLWYPVEGQPTICVAPDTLVAIGRPSGYRGSYKQWEEGGLAPQVVFEVRSPNNTPAEMRRKCDFYDRHGCDEYYLYDPDGHELSGWRRFRGAWRAIKQMDGWTSPRLGIRFDMSGDELRIFGPDGEPFERMTDIALARRAAENQVKTEQARTRAAKEQVRAEQARTRAAEEAARADRAQAQAAHANSARLAEKLRQLGIDPDT